MASYWNLPIISWVATDPMFNDKITFNTMGRSLGAFDKMGMFLMDIFDYYGWKRVSIISSSFLIWNDGATAVALAFKYRIFK